MRLVKYAVWIAGLALLIWLAYTKGFQGGSAYIQFVDGLILDYGAGMLVANLPAIKRFVQSHHRLHERLDSLERKHDELHKFIKGRDGDDTDSR